MYKKEDTESKKDGYRFIQLVTQSIAWLQIVASPLIIGLIIGGIIYYSNPSIARLIIGIMVSLVGLVVGIKWATKKWKGKGTIEFMFKTMATPELDKWDDEENSDSKNSCCQ